MKLYLSSYRIPELTALTTLVGKQPADTTVALIPNAKDYYAPRARGVKIRLVQGYLEALGFTVAVVDLQDYPRSPEKLKEQLQRCDMLWVMGGNPFNLREAMEASGFNTIITDVIEAGVVFAGESAGACIAGTSLHGIDLIDDPEYAETVLWDGLELSPHYFIPHADNEEMRDGIQQIIAEHKNDPHAVVLNDDQVWVEHDGEGQVLTGSKPKKLEG